MPEDIILQELKTKFCQASEAIPYFTVKYRIFLPFLCPQSDVGSVVILSLGNHVILSLSCLSFLCPPVIRFQVQKDSERGRPLTHYYCRHILTAAAASFQMQSLNHTFSFTFSGMKGFWETKVP